MINRFNITSILYFVIIVAFIGGIFDLVSNTQKMYLSPQKEDVEDFTQPPLSAGVYPWSIRSIDTQVISKHWPNVTRSAIQEQVLLLKNLGVNYIAVGTPYDRADELRMWAEEIHAAGLNVWFRSHWAEWEGDEGKPARMSPEDYLYRTELFIQNNPDLFKEDDAFTVCVEAEQVGVGLGKRFLTWDQYREFLLSQIIISNRAFEKIGFKGKIYTNWISVNGWIVENQFTQELVDKLGLIVVDHFVGQTKTIGDYSDTETAIQQTIRDLDRFSARWKVPIFLGEWGYQIFQNVPEDQQAYVLENVLSQLVTKDYLVGMNYWVHMGNSASLIKDEYGSNLQYRIGALVLKKYYDAISSNTPIATDSAVNR